MTPPALVVVDASYMIDVLLGSADLPNAAMSAPAHFDTEVVSAWARLHKREVIDLEATLLTADLRVATACRQQGWCEVLTPLGR